ncbi:MAG: hypothetical protein HFI80_06110 [Lachnospiraceae bacterium]|nr:hypothetical protein [Lachnospiraceae bacterium]MCI9661101.1 hypothetical protein [Lachnospiraceae bacterium]
MKILKKAGAGIMAALLLTANLSMPVMAHGHGNCHRSSYCDGSGYYNGNSYCDGSGYRNTNTSRAKTKRTYCSYHETFHKTKKSCKNYCKKHKTTHYNGKRHSLKKHHSNHHR